MNRWTSSDAGLPQAPDRDAWDRRLLTLAQRDQIFTRYGDAEFRSKAVVKGDERLLQCNSAAVVEALCQSLGRSIAGHEGIPDCGTVAVEMGDNALFEPQIEIASQQ